MLLYVIVLVFEFGNEFYVVGGVEIYILVLFYVYGVFLFEVY